jgi:hypothetical protein
MTSFYTFYGYWIILGYEFELQVQVEGIKVVIHAPLKWGEKFKREGFPVTKLYVMNI